MKYRTIVADPPWYYDKFGYLDKNGYHYEALPYDSMSVEEICALPVRQLRPEYKVGAALFLWTTNLYLRDAFDVIDSWGFRYRQTVTWHKVNALRGRDDRARSARFGQHRWHGDKWPSSVAAGTPGAMKLCCT